MYLLYSFAAAKGPWAFDLARFTVIVAACIIIFYLPFVLRHFIDLYERNKGKEEHVVDIRLRSLLLCHAMVGR